LTIQQQTDGHRTTARTALCTALRGFGPNWQRPAVFVDSEGVCFLGGDDLYERVFDVLE